MKIAVVGSRSFKDYDYLVKKLDEVIFGFEEFGDIHEFEIVSGGAKGADRMAEWYAEFREYPIKIFLPDWDKYGKSAGYKRNQRIVDSSDVVAAFWDGESRGTKHSIDLAVKQNKQVLIYTDWKGKDDGLSAFSS
jgi:hypothetical protein